MKILNFGSLNLDKVYKVAHFVREGETISAQEQNQFLGGKGLNQSVALSRAGIFVEHAGAVGRETTEFHALLKAEGAGTTYLRVLETVSGHAVIQSCAGQNCIIVYGGANRMTRPQDVDAFLKDYGPGDLLLLQNETSCVRYAMEQAREKGMTVAFNPSPIDGSLTQDVLALADVLFVNETEGGLLSGTPASENEAVLAALAERFPRAAVVLTVGGEGALYRKGGVLLRQRAYPVKVVDTTAAGDTFTGVFSGGYERGFDPGKCLRCANMAAALAVSREGASASIPHGKYWFQRGAGNRWRAYGEQEPRRFDRHWHGASMEKRAAGKRRRMTEERGEWHEHSHSDPGGARIRTGPAGISRIFP
ncbi:MAG: ribokinase [Ruthenibacterium lactatiformans]